LAVLLVAFLYFATASLLATIFMDAPPTWVKVPGWIYFATIIVSALGLFVIWPVLETAKETVRQSGWGGLAQTCLTIFWKVGLLAAALYAAKWL
jgi:hypothetical protein